MQAKVRAILEREIDKLDTLSQLPSALDLEHVQRLAALVRCLSAVSAPAKNPADSDSSDFTPQISTEDLLRDVLSPAHQQQTEDRRALEKVYSPVAPALEPTDSV